MADTQPEETVTISRKEYEDLLDDQKWRLAVESAGVDNWSGYEYAMEEYNSDET